MDIILNKNKTSTFSFHKDNINCTCYLHFHKKKKNKIKHKPNKYTTTKCINLTINFYFEKKMKPYSQGILFASNELPEFKQTNLI